MKNVVIIPAAGSGKRFGGELPKQFVELSGIPVIIRTLQRFDDCSEITAIIIAINSELKDLLTEQIDKFAIKKEILFADGGVQRQDSVFNALQTSAAQSSDIILVHDAVRPFIDGDFIRKIIKLSEEFGAVVPALIPKETLKIADSENFVLSTPDRSKLFSIQTPQGFRSEILIKSYNTTIKGTEIFTDDASVAESAGYKVKITEGMEENIKITSPFDFEIAKLILKRWGK